MGFSQPHRLLLSAAILALALAAPAFGGAVVEIPVTASEAPAIYPGSAPGQMKSWVQLVWDPAKRELARQSYTAWDPIPSLGLDLQWRPDDPAAALSGPLNGKGTLLFRRKGAPSYDQSAEVAQYRGTLVDGRAEGEGSWLDSSGYGYEGQWRQGLMHGEGRLMLPNGDEYAGLFADGRRQGRGLYIDATGAIYDGGFASDLRDGEGIFVPARGEPYRADWLAGLEVVGTRAQLDPETLDYVRIVAAEYQEVPDLRVGLIAERRPHNFDLGIEPMSYTSKSDGARLDIFPDDQRLMDVWRGGAPIELTDEELVRFSSTSEGFTPSFLGYYERYEPLSLVFELENISTETVAVVGGFIDVAESARQPEPAVQLRPDHEHECGAGLWYRPDVFLDNFGWGAADNARMTLAFGGTDGRLDDTSASKEIGTLETSAKIDLTAELQAIGVNTAVVGSEDFRCTDRSDKRLCLGEIRQSGRYGELSEFIALNDSVIEAKVSGTLDYDWAAPDGTPNHKSSPFGAVLQLGHLANDAECGEGGEIIPLKHDPFTLKLDEKNYKIAIPFAGEVTPGFTMRWRIELKAPETSEHDFQLVLVLADGRQIASRPVHLVYFEPPVRDIPNELMGF
ncbi:MAG: hypothetical protein ABIO40_06995 [Devosia sp.]